MIMNRFLDLPGACPATASSPSFPFSLFRKIKLALPAIDGLRKLSLKKWTMEYRCRCHNSTKCFNRLSRIPTMEPAGMGVLTRSCDKQRSPSVNFLKTRS